MKVLQSGKEYEGRPNFIGKRFIDESKYTPKYKTYTKVVHHHKLGVHSTEPKVKRLL